MLYKEFFSISLNKKFLYIFEHVFYKIIETNIVNLLWEPFVIGSEHARSNHWKYHK